MHPQKYARTSTSPTRGKRVRILKPSFLTCTKQSSHSNHGFGSIAIQFSRPDDPAIPSMYIYIYIYTLYLCVYQGYFVFWLLTPYH